MRWYGHLLLCIASLLLASATAAQDDPDRIVADIYEAYSGHGLGISPTDPANRDMFSARLQGLLEKEEALVERDGLGALDFDVFVDGQDFDVSDVRVDAPEFAGEAASVTVSLLNFGEPRRLRFLFVEEGGRWRIDDIVSARADAPWTLTALLDGG